MGLQRPSVGPQFKLLFLTVFQKVRGKFPFELVFPTYLNPLSSNPTKWSNTLKQFVKMGDILQLHLLGFLRQILSSKNIKDMFNQYLWGHCFEFIINTVGATIDQSSFSLWINITSRINQWRFLTFVSLYLDICLIVHVGALAILLSLM